VINLLIRLMLLSAALQLGITAADIAFCGSRECARRIEKASRDVLRLNWRPISVWPEEGKRFK
jgi:hypothetical protein